MENKKNWQKEELKASNILSPVPVVLLSCAGLENRENEGANAITIAWVGTVNSDPPMVSVSIRPERWSHGQISDTAEFVINLVSQNLLKACDYCGVRSGKNENKLEKMGLSLEVASGLTYAPAIKDSPVNISCKVKQVIKLGSHDMFLAEIVAVKVASHLLDEKKQLDLKQANLTNYMHGEYFSIGEKQGFFGYSLASKEVLKRRMASKYTDKNRCLKTKNKKLKNKKKYK